MEFQSTLLQEERPGRSAVCRAGMYFNPRSYKRSDIHFIQIPYITDYFNPRSYKRSDWRCHLLLYYNMIFQSTLLQEERRHLFRDSLHTSVHFNPRSYKRSDNYQHNLLRRNPIFQSTLLQEERRLPTLIWDIFIIISIHAPTRGATFLRCLCRILQSNFNPRSYKRSDDELQKYINMREFISIHAPTRGATLYLPIGGFHLPISIHAPTRGATCTLFLLVDFRNISIHAPTRGATCLSCQCCC